MSDAMDAYVRSAAFAQRVLGEIDPSTHDQDSACAGWTVREAINHLIGGQHYFAGAAQGGAREEGDGPPDFTMGDTVDAHVRATTGVVEAFTDEVQAGTVKTVRGDLPGGMLLGIATLENVLHAWDAGKGAGLSPEVPDEIAEQVLGIITAITGHGPSQDFADPVEVADDASITDRILARSGRRP